MIPDNFVCEWTRKEDERKAEGLKNRRNPGCSG
jgi:hypothetical protein